MLDRECMVDPSCQILPSCAIHQAKYPTSAWMMGRVDELVLYEWLMMCTTDQIQEGDGETAHMHHDVPLMAIQ